MSTDEAGPMGHGLGSQLRPILVEFLRSAFVSSELQRLLHACGGDDVLAQLQGGSHADVAMQCGQILARNGLIDDALFFELAKLRPARRAEVERLRSVHLGAPEAATDARVSASDAPTRAELRRLVSTSLRSDADLDAFCLDHFPAVYDRFSDGMQRTSKVTLLILHVDPGVLARTLTGHGGPELHRQR